MRGEILILSRLGRGPKEIKGRPQTPVRFPIDKIVY